MSWILILTLITFDGVAMQVVPGFSSEDQCKSAYSLWANNTKDRAYARSVSGACVKVGDKK